MAAASALGWKDFWKSLGLSMHLLDSIVMLLRFQIGYNRMPDFPVAPSSLRSEPLPSVEDRPAHNQQGEFELHISHEDEGKMESAPDRHPSSAASYTSMNSWNLNRSSKGKEQFSGQSGSIVKDSSKNEEGAKSLSFYYDMNPPIKQVLPEKIAAEAKEFRKGISSFYGEDEDYHSQSPSHSEKGASPLSVEAEAWRKRHTESEQIAADIARLPRVEKGLGEDLKGSLVNNVFAYKIADQAASMVALSHFRGGTEVELLAGHPGASAAGLTMIEKAVNESQTKGFNGLIRLYTYASAQKFYESCGFNVDGFDFPLVKMKLDPNESDLWKFEQNSWIYKPLEGQKYLVLGSISAQP